MSEPPRARRSPDPAAPVTGGGGAAPGGNRWDLLVRARGSDAARFEPFAPGHPDPLPDVVKRFAGCTRLGMFGGPRHDPSRCDARVRDTAFDPAAGERSWRLTVEGVDPGAFLVLYNVLAARELDAFEILEESTGDPLPIPDRYPGVWPTRFRALHSTPARESRDRGVRVVLADEPDDPTLDAIYRDLTVWCEQILLGGYATDRLPPWKSTAVPDPAFLDDPVSIEQTFNEAFLCHEAAFHAVVNWATRLDAAGTRVSEVLIR